MTTLKNAPYRKTNITYAQVYIDSHGLVCDVRFDDPKHPVAVMAQREIDECNGDIGQLDTDGPGLYRLTVHGLEDAAGRLDDYEILACDRARVTYPQES